ncbi:unnamed protein product [Diabrotica balteata]|uniref:Tetraspanin n=1 Tax=Diabrotica balteata TaxID=107213 RepID=A0A9N9SVG9_DIABA|nr:unnamed protein product [Diabrotica balteata]
MVKISKKNNVRLKQLLRKMCLIALDELTEALEKRVWTRPCLLKRNDRGSSSLVLEELLNEDIKESVSILRMMSDVFDVLLSLVMPKIQQHTIMREALPARAECCGVRGPSDWKTITKSDVLPHTCCPHTQDNDSCTINSEHVYQASCLTNLKEIFVKYGIIIGGVGLGIAALQLIGIIFACCLARSIRKEYETV